MSDDWETGPACYEGHSEDETEWLAPPKLGRDEGEFSGDELDWQAVDASSAALDHNDATEDTDEAPPVSGDCDIGNVQEAATFVANPFSYARQAAQQRARRRRSPTPPLVNPSRFEQVPEKPLPHKPIEAAFARQRQKAVIRPAKPVERLPVTAVETPIKKRKKHPRMATPPPVERSLNCPSPPKSQRRWPHTPSSLNRPPSLTFKEESVSPPKFSRPLQDSPFRSPSPTSPPRQPAPKLSKSTFQLMQVYEPPPRAKVSLIPLPTVRAGGALTQKPARRMHRPFRSPASLRPTPFVSSSEESPFAAFTKSRQPQYDNEEETGEEDLAQWKRM